MSWLTGKGVTSRVTGVARRGGPDSGAATEFLKKGRENAQIRGDDAGAEKYKNALRKAART